MKTSRHPWGRNRGPKKVQESREYLIRNMRDVVILCSQLIIVLYCRDLEVARAKAETTRRMLREQRGQAEGSLDRYIAVPEQGLVEIV